MCGIAAILAPNEALNPELIKRALPVLKHRGPDEHNSWTAHHGHISLGHTRLSIIGLSNGRQPMSNETGDIWSVVNGEFYDFEQIRNELRAKGHQFRTDSDSEIALHLYEDMGTTFMRRLRGEFAVVLWDERRQSSDCCSGSVWDQTALLRQREWKNVHCIRDKGSIRTWRSGLVGQGNYVWNTLWFRATRRENHI